MFGHNSPVIYSGEFSDVSVVEPSMILHQGMDSSALMTGVILTVHYSDERENLSAAKNLTSNGIIRDAQDVIKRVLDNETVLAKLLGNRIECDVIVLYSRSQETQGFILNNVPMVQWGGIHDYETRVPRGCLNWNGAGDRVDFFKLDGDHVLVGFIGGSFPEGAVILGCLPHPLNKTDVPRGLHGTFGVPKEFGDKNRKDGKVHIQKYNGTVKQIDRNGNLIIDTTQADKHIGVDSNSGHITETQDEVSHTVDPTSASPGGGSVELRVKNQRKVKVSFHDNSKDPDKTVYPPLYEETGNIEITNDADTTKIEINLSGSVHIQVNKGSSGDGKLVIDADKCTINTATTPAGIILGDENGLALTPAEPLQLVTKHFVEQLFASHTHSLYGFPTTGPYINGVLVIPGTPINESTGLWGAYSPFKIGTTKTKVE